MRKQPLHPRTITINQKQKHLSKKSRLEALSWLSETFPHLFNNSKSIRPLSLGIMDDILKHADKAASVGISKSKLREAVVLFTRRIDYLTCLKAREMRIDLQGNVTESVTEEDAERAAIKIKKRIEKSAKTARSKQAPHSSIGTLVQRKAPAEFTPYYPEHEPAFSAKNCASSPKIASVTVKHKASKPYDPDAVARLKEKLGLSRKTEEA